MQSTPFYESQPSVILGFHGCDEEVGMRVLCDPEEHLTPSAQSYDWLGSGIYFWEGSLDRAWDWARGYEARGRIKKAFVLGAVIDLKHCLDMFDSGSSEQVSAAYQSLESFMHKSQTPMPENTGPAALDKPARHLDCAVMNTLHQMREDKKLLSYDSVRGAFLEGNAIYPGAGFRSQTHIQICVRAKACIKGYFKPINVQA